MSYQVSGFERIEAPNPRRPSTFQRWLAAGAAGSVVGLGVILGLGRVLPDTLPPGVGWLVILTPLACVLAAYRLLERAWPARVTLERDEGVISGATRARAIPVGHGVVAVVGAYGRTARWLRHDVYTIRYLPRDGVSDNVTLQAGCTDAVRVRDFAERLCLLGGYTLHWHAPGSREREVRTPDQLGWSLAEGAGAPRAAVAAARPDRARLRVEWMEDGSLRVRGTGPAARTLGRLLMWLVAASALAVALELIRPGGWPAVMAGSMAVVLALAVLVSAADWVLRREYRFGPDSVRCRAHVCGVPLWGWSVAAAAVHGLRLQDDETSLHLIGPGLRRRIHLGTPPRPGELRWILTQAELALSGEARSLPR